MRCNLIRGYTIIELILAVLIIVLSVYLASDIMRNSQQNTMPVSNDVPIEAPANPGQ